MKGGFNTVTFSEEVCNDVRVLLRRYREGWAMTLKGAANGVGQ